MQSTHHHHHHHRHHHLHLLILILLLLLLLPSPSLSQPTWEEELESVSSRYPLTHTVFGGGGDEREFVLFWKVLSPNEISFAAISNLDGYVGVGFSPTGYMAESIAALCRYTNPPVCEERLLLDRTPSQVLLVEDSPHMSESEYRLVDGFSFIEFTWDLSLPNEIYNFTTNTPTGMVFSASPVSGVVYHGNHKSSRNTITFSTGEGSLPYAQVCSDCDHGSCDGSLFCVCEDGWEGDRCDQNLEDPHLDLVRDGYEYSADLIEGYLSVHWRPVTSSSTSIDFAVRSPWGSVGWVGVGFSGNNGLKMVGSDAVIGTISNSVVNAYQLDSKTVSGVKLSNRLTVTNTSLTVVDGVATMKFTRLLKDGRYPLLPTYNDHSLIGAVGSTTSLEEHSIRSSTALNVNLSTGDYTEVAGVFHPLKVFHGTLMLISWGIIIPIGILLARYGPTCLPEKWIIVHSATQMLGFTIGIGGIIVAFLSVEGAHYRTEWHGQLGTVVIILGVAQMMAGIFRKNSKDRSRLRRIMVIVHPWGGRILTIAAIVQLFKGLTLIPDFFPAIIFYIAFLGVLVVFVIVRETVFPDGFGCGESVQRDRANWRSLKGYNYPKTDSRAIPPPTSAWKLGPFSLVIRRSMILFGRSTTCNYILQDDRVSGKHAVIQFKQRPEGVVPYLYDLGSTKGTKVNGASIAPRTFVALHEGDKITFANEDPLTLVCAEDALTTLSDSSENKVGVRRRLRRTRSVSLTISNSIVSTDVSEGSGTGGTHSDASQSLSSSQSPSASSRSGFSARETTVSVSASSDSRSSFFTASAVDASDAMSASELSF
eukprot:TRINITY_DN1689_c0_g3_i2.p1 TRINITY_DN1689_c0_g3~~TRINITY_DN1689_c0_g3_i2.p1  ORF type:complete len:875 (+),score=164.72 TRINITY_DN1689_c0_g3_i2:169-2625(+)